jgi:hypothetical protein
MAGKAQFTIGAEASCSDGPCGETSTQLAARLTTAPARKAAAANGY